MRPFCRQGLPNCLAGRMPAQASGSAGARQRSAPTGGRAKGRPFQDQVPERALSSTPSTWPWAVLRTVGASAGGVVGGVVGVMVGVVAAAGGGTLNGGGGGSAAGG